jgi:hypothetical protein
MKLVQINIDHDLSPAELDAGAADALKFAEEVAALPGIHWKIWIGEQSRRELGGIYLFASERAAKDFLTGPIFAAIRSNPRFQKVEAKLFDVNEAASLITKAPLPVAAT